MDDMRDAQDMQSIQDMRDAEDLEGAAGADDLDDFDALAGSAGTGEGAVDLWTRRVLALSDDIDEGEARAVVEEIWDAASLREVDVYEEEVAEREDERDE
ncbi:hypothetical protein [Streptomyces sp. NPDC049879]|uniref:hypothetical protein n=1 Tax=Streptomyces sp. NPDC049879 TaxID=3365598 RepID=UPI00379FB212